VTKINTPTFTGGISAEANSLVKLFYDGIQVGSGTADGVGSYSIVASVIPDGLHNMTVTATDVAGNTSVASNATSVRIDTVQPVFSAPTFNYLNAHLVIYSFSEQVFFFDKSHFALFNLTSNSSIAPASINYAFNAPQGARFTFSGLGGFNPTVLPDGNYRATISANGSSQTQDSAGNTPLTVIDTFFVLTADANHDRHVETGDFNVLSLNFNQTSGMNYGTGDFNYDGKVNALDFNAISSNFGQPPLGSPSLGTLVPEPASLGFLALASFVAARRRRGLV